MSQAGEINSASGPVPPDVPIIFQAQTNGVNDGTATAAANILNVNGINGIVITASGNTLTISETEQFLTGTATTVDATTANISTLIPIPDDSATSIIVNIVGKAVGGGSCSGESIGLAENTSGVVTIVGTSDVTRNNTAALAAWNVTLIVSGTNAAVQVLGVAGFTINWRATMEVVSAP